MVDTDKPVFDNCPTDIMVECGAEVPAAPTVTATDICDGVIIPTFVESQSEKDCGGGYVITRTWTATDECGNAATCEQLVTVKPCLSSVSGWVYYDANDNGLREPALGEVGIGSVLVTLTGTDCRGETVNVTATTNADGSYSFTGLWPGTYTVTETQPTGWDDGKDTPGTPFGGSASVNDVISSMVIPQDGVSYTGVDYNFGELKKKETCWACPTDPSLIVGKMIVAQDACYIYMRYDQININDNTYGKNSAWGPNKIRTFKQLVTSDQAGFRIVDASGAVLMDWHQDYISAVTKSAAAPSGYDCLGPFGGDGLMITPPPAGTWEQAFAEYTTSFDADLNLFGYFDPPKNGIVPLGGTGVCAGSVNLLTESPPVTNRLEMDVSLLEFACPDAFTTVRTIGLTGAPEGINRAVTGWDFVNSYWAKLYKPALGIPCGEAFAGSIIQTEVHNSPFRMGICDQVFVPVEVPCPPEP